MSETHQADERPEYFVNKVVVMDVKQGNFDHAEGDPVAVLFIAREDVIEPTAFHLNEAKLVVTQLLVALATFDDHFAKAVLDAKFPTDPEGRFKWPDLPYNESL